MVVWNVIAVSVNFLGVGAYFRFVRKEKNRQESKRIPLLLLSRREYKSSLPASFETQPNHDGIGIKEFMALSGRRRMTVSPARYRTALLSTDQP